MNKNITIKVDKELWDQLKVIAKKEGRKLTWYVETILQEYINDWEKENQRK